MRGYRGVKKAYIGSREQSVDMAKSLYYIRIDAVA